MKTYSSKGAATHGPCRTQRMKHCSIGLTSRSPLRAPVQVLKSGPFDTSGVIYHIDSTEVIENHGDVTNANVTATILAAVAFLGGEQVRAEPTQRSMLDAHGSQRRRSLVVHIAKNASGMVLQMAEPI
jgi:hypothetical protein